MCNVEGPPLKKRKPQPLPQVESLPIYLDYNATTPLCEEAWAAMSANKNVWGNPSSTHPYGLAAKYALDQARETTGRALHASDPSNTIVFTSGGTESNNLAIIGGALGVHDASPERHYVISSSTEHPAVAEVLTFLDKGGTSAPMKQLLVAVDRASGCVTVGALSAAIMSIPEGPGAVALVTIMHANNETGSINPIADLVRTVKALSGSSALFHCDAAQSLGKIQVDVEELGVDLLSVCSHKFYGPKGIGALYVKSGVQLKNILFGAGHERGIRPGTENVILASGMAEALRIACDDLQRNVTIMSSTRGVLLSALTEELEKVGLRYVVNGSLQTALPNTLNIAIFREVPSLKRQSAEIPKPVEENVIGVNGSGIPQRQRAGTDIVFISSQRLMDEVGDRVCVSAGSACHSTSGDEPLVVSTPLQGVGVDIERAIGTLRLSTGRMTTPREARDAARIIARRAAQQFAE